ncbi:hypothetical protein [uncultured Kordia sp.]|uniref:hypothetical protein n=1 Tax=uncultured Kordia sp. TaxID=507699 RepID=UPI00260649CF|nr:hypothetical protein [uncultured Kordia sp.]
MTQFVDPELSIESWSALAQQAPVDGIISLFEKSGNSFPLTLNAKMKAAERLHIYFGLDGSGNIQFYAIPADLDQESNKTIYSCGASVALDATQQTVTSNSNSPLVGWVNNWCNETLRNNWLTGLDQAVQVFVIHTTDFVVNDLHKCYLSLKPGAAKGQYTVDLVIQNTVTGMFLNVEEPSADDDALGAQFADMARPVPPFGQEGHTSTDASNFGVFQALGIQ